MGVTVPSWTVAPFYFERGRLWENTYIDKLYEAQADGEDFQNLDKLIPENAGEYLEDYREMLPPLDYEKVRDAVFPYQASQKISLLKSALRPQWA